MECYKCGIDVTDRRETCQVCGFKACNKQVEKAVSNVTAFRSFNEMVEAMNGGYVPTIRPTNAQSRFLAEFIREMGFRVYLGIPQ